MGYTVYIILVPMVMFLFIGLGSKWLRPRAAGLCGTLGMAVSALLSYLTAYRYFFVEGLEGDAYRALTAWSAQWLRFSDTLHIDMGVLLGRKSSVEVPEGAKSVKLEDPTRTISRHHAAISFDQDGTLWIEDYESLNGTYIIQGNEETKVEHKPIKFEAPCTIRIGDQFFTLEQR